MHALDEFHEEDGWDVARCTCRYVSPPCPDKETAANFWGQHLLETNK